MGGGGGGGGGGGLRYDFGFSYIFPKHISGGRHIQIGYQRQM